MKFMIEDLRYLVTVKQRYSHEAIEFYANSENRETL